MIWWTRGLTALAQSQMNVSHTRQQVISGQVITRIQSWHITSVRHAMLPRHQTRNMDKGAEKRKTAAAFSHTGDACAPVCCEIHSVHSAPLNWKLKRQKNNKTKLNVCLAFLSLLPPAQILDVRNVLVVVSRWYGGILLGPDRFKHINNCARNLLVDEGYAASAVRRSPGLLWITVIFHWHIISQTWPYCQWPSAGQTPAVLYCLWLAESQIGTFSLLKNAFWQAGPDVELCVVSVAPRRLLRVGDIASFEVSRPARLAGIKRSPTAHGLPEVRSGPLWSRLCVFVNLFHWNFHWTLSPPAPLPLPSSTFCCRCPTLD